MNDMDIDKVKNDLRDKRIDGAYSVRIAAVEAIEALEREVRKCDDRIDCLSAICAETYQVVGSLASDAGMFNTDAVQKALDNLSQQKMVHNDVLPFPSNVDSVEILADTDANAPWLTIAHMCCTDAGIEQGHITDRMNKLRDKIEKWTAVARALSADDIINQVKK